MFFEPSPTPYDISWRMFGTHIRVSPWFWLTTVLLGWSGTGPNFVYLFVWVACVFVSVLVHEFGHVVMGRMFGSDGHIILFALGGLAVGSNALSNRWQRIAVCFAGPGAEFVLLAIVLAFAWKGIHIRWDETGYIPWPHFSGLENLSRPMNAAIAFLIWINLAWGCLNLLPIWPLDGGQISRDLLSWVSPENGLKTAYGMSMVVAGVLALNAALPPGRAFIPWLGGEDWFMAIFFASFAFNSYQALQAENRRQPWDSDREEW